MKTPIKRQVIWLPLDRYGYSRRLLGVIPFILRLLEQKMIYQPAPSKYQTLYFHKMFAESCVVSRQSFSPIMLGH
jgi:hypothetical protein